VEGRMPRRRWRGGPLARRRQFLAAAPDLTPGRAALSARPERGAAHGAASFRRVESLPRRGAVGRLAGQRRARRPAPGPALPAGPVVSRGLLARQQSPHARRARKRRGGARRGARLARAGRRPGLRGVRRARGHGRFRVHGVRGRPHCGPGGDPRSRAGRARAHPRARPRSRDARAAPRRPPHRTGRGDRSRRRQERRLPRGGVPRRRRGGPPLDRLERDRRVRAGRGACARGPADGRAGGAGSHVARAGAFRRGLARRAVAGRPCLGRGRRGAPRRRRAALRLRARPRPADLRVGVRLRPARPHGRVGRRLPCAGQRALPRGRAGPHRGRAGRPHLAPVRPARPGLA
jgi:hypothetical protein